MTSPIPDKDDLTQCLEKIKSCHTFCSESMDEPMHALRLFEQAINIRTNLNA